MLVRYCRNIFEVFVADVHPWELTCLARVVESNHGGCFALNLMSMASAVSFRDVPFFSSSYNDHIDYEVDGQQRLQVVRQLKLWI